MTKAKEVPLKTRTVQIGMVTAVLLVVLRLGLGCHFFYEGVWKATHSDEFTAEPFLTQAKGPFAPIFYGMVPDLDGWERLNIEMTAGAEQIIEHWRKARIDARNSYEKELKKKIDKEAKEVKAAEEKQREELAAFDRDTLPILWEAEDRLEAHLAENEEAMVEYLTEKNNKNDQADEEEDELTEEAENWIVEADTIEKECLESLAAAVKERTGDDLDVSQKVPQDKKKRTPNRIFSAKPRIKGSDYLADWEDVKTKAIRRYGLDEDQQYELEAIFRRYKDAMKNYLLENQEDIAGYFGSVSRFHERKNAGTNGAIHEKKRIWEEQQELRREVGKWLGDLEKMRADFRTDAWHVLTEDQKKLGEIPEKKNFIHFINFAVTWGLTAIGFCLLLGLFTRPAALGGAAFLTFVVLTQLSWPSIYPPAPAVAGHALLIDRNVIELIALLLIASCGAGRWAGLDYFVEHYIIKWCKSCPCMKCLCKTDTGADDGNEKDQAEEAASKEAASKEAASKEAASKEDKAGGEKPEDEKNPKTEKEGG